MDMLEGIYTRRSVRQYPDQPVEREQLLEIVKAGMFDRGPGASLGTETKCRTEKTSPTFC